MIIKNISDPTLIHEALKNNKAVILPTDTVYGLCATASNEKAIENIFHIKQRDKNKPLQLLVKDERYYFEKYPFKQQLRTILSGVPAGKVTWLFPNNQALSQGQCSYFKNLPFIGVRTPVHPLWEKIFEIHNNPIAATSANISGQPVFDEPEIIKVFGNIVSLICLENRPPSQEPSAVIQILSPAEIKIVRKSSLLSSSFYDTLQPYISQ